ncbi:uncharacterized protein [Lolium perenne]|uniref:uncharacterized protein n=1 Tax=Lolium perenne TaxID=4522 RepID=UPI0021F5F72F|nr:uncharacterized protein LOC127315527 [Lolium perenne]
MEHLARDPTPRTRVYRLMAEGMSFKVTVALRARRVEKWICAVKRDYLDNTPIKCISMYCEFTNPREGDQRAAVLQLSVVSENLVFQICHGDEVPQVLREFLQDGNIRFCGTAISKDVEMLSPYEQVRNAALDSCLGFEMAGRHWMLVGDNSHVDRLNI